MTTKPITVPVLIYDSECPACRYYSRLVRVRESVGGLHLVDARQDSAVTQEITAAGLDLDQGMVLKVDSQVYYGADAMHALALMGGRSGIFNRLNYAIFKSSQRARYLYPVLRLLRNGLLRLLGKSKINNLNKTDT